MLFTKEIKIANYKYWNVMNNDNGECEHRNYIESILPEHQIIN